MGAIAGAALAALPVPGLGAETATATASAGGERPRAQQRTGRAESLQRFRSCDPLRNYLRAHRRALSAPPPMPVTPVPAGAAVGAGEAAALADAPPAGSQTNVQEQGVDEPDIVKAAGETIFALAGGRLEAVDAGAGAPTSLGSLRLPRALRGEASGGAQLLLFGDRALVMASVDRTVPGPPGVDSIVAGPAGSRTLLIEVDVGDPTAMRIVRTLTVDGSLVSARLSEATARVVIDSQPGLPVARRGHGRAWLPAARLRDREAGERSRTRLVRCSQVRRAPRFAGAGMLTVLTIDLTRGLPAIDADAVLSSGEIVYASPTSLYVATERWLGADPGRGRLSDVNTQIHRFDTGDPRATTYLASGTVTGFMLSQWSMSEQEGVLRVASTSSPAWAPGGPQSRSQSFITTLARDGDHLARVGRLGGIGEGESVYAVRFLGRTAYVVTFRQVDPLYVIDLSNPAAPALAGELEIPGYSAYLHPVGEGLLLGIGQDADRRGVTRGVQVSLFDVADPARPARLAVHSLGRDTASEVEADHHAFFYAPELRLAVIPVESEGGGAADAPAALRIDPGAAPALARLAMAPPPGADRSPVRRILGVGARLFTVSERGITAYDPATLAPLASLAFLRRRQG